MKMNRRQAEREAGGFALLTLFLIGVISCCMVYTFLSAPESTLVLLPESLGQETEEEFSCCRGIEHLELWGKAVKWGSKFKLNSSRDCCVACKKICQRNNNNMPCLCDSWVFCGDPHACGPRFGECWLKKQKNHLEPDRRDSGALVMWTSGFLSAKGEDVVGLETEHGIMRIKLLPECAPHSVFYILELLQLRHCSGCQFYRAESRGDFWDSEGNHQKNAPFGPPFALLQGTLEAHGTIFQAIPPEFCPSVRRGSVAWVGSGPDFFISLANHVEWNKVHTVFGLVLHQDMGIAEKISKLPTKTDIWSNVSVSVLEKSVALQFVRVETASDKLML